MMPFLDVAIRATLVLLAALLATVALRRAAAATRHLAWTLAVVCVLMLPMLMVVAPDWQILPTGATAERGPAMPRLEVADPPADRLFGAAEVAFALWTLGTCVLVVRIFAGVQSVRRLARHAWPANGRCRRLLDEATACADVTGPIRLLVSGDIAVPMTWGSRRPLLLLPQEAAEWSDERIRVVLLHELAHIRRADWLTHAIARATVACHWFNPLAWIAMRAMTREQERACDDFVIVRGAVATEYAQHLLDMARGDRSGPGWTIAPAMARRVELEGRLLSILTPRRREPGHFAAPAITLAAVALVLVVASAAPTASPQQPVSEARLPAAPPSVVRTEDMAAATREARRERESRDRLSGALDNRSEDVRERAAVALAFSANADAVAPLLRALKDPSAQVREKAAMGLTFRRRPDVADALLAAAQDANSQVREKAVFALSVSGDPRAIGALTIAARDADEQVREKAVLGLALASVTARDHR